LILLGDSNLRMADKDGLGCSISFHQACCLYQQRVPSNPSRRLMKLLKFSSRSALPTSTRRIGIADGFDVSKFTWGCHCSSSSNVSTISRTEWPRPEPMFHAPDS